MGGAVVKNPSANAKDARHGFHHWVRNISWGRKWQTTSVSLPGKPLDRGTWWATTHGVLREADATMQACTNDRCSDIIFSLVSLLSLSL